MQSKEQISQTEFISFSLISQGKYRFWRCCHFILSFNIRMVSELIPQSAKHYEKTSIISEGETYET